MSDEKKGEKPQKIEKLTPEQIAMFEPWREKWLKVGLCTDRITVEMATPILERFGKEVLGKVPTKIIVEPSPIAAWKTVSRIACEEELKKLQEQEGGKIQIDLDEMKPLSFIWSYIDGNFSAGYFGFYTFMIDVVGVKLQEDTKRKFDAYLELSKLSLVYPLDCGTWVLADHPEEIHMKEGRLHKDGGPAIRYSDGFSIWCLNGVEVPQWLAETNSNKLDPAKFAEMQNAEVRREFIRKVGVERICTELGTECLDKKDCRDNKFWAKAKKQFGLKDRDAVYELHLVDLKGRTGKWPYLKMLNPSIGVWHMEAVDRKCKTVEEALEFRNQTTEVPEQLT
jgi:hypothetical protein